MQQTSLQQNHLKARCHREVMFSFVVHWNRNYVVGANLKSVPHPSWRLGTDKYSQVWSVVRVNLDHIGEANSTKCLGNDDSCPSLPLAELNSRRNYVPDAGMSSRFNITDLNGLVCNETEWAWPPDQALPPGQVRCRRWWPRMRPSWQ